MYHYCTWALTSYVLNAEGSFFPYSYDLHYHGRILILGQLWHSEELWEQQPLAGVG